jgi:hypothetical protein
MKGEPVTNRQRALIKKWTRARKLQQQEMGAKLGLCYQTVLHTQKKLGLRQYVPDRQPLSKKTESKIVGMLRQNLGRLHIARQLGVSLEKIDRISLRIRFRRRSRQSRNCLPSSQTGNRPDPGSTDQKRKPNLQAVSR